MTITELIALAMRDANIIGEGESATGAQTQDALDTLNQMLAQWSTENATIYAQQEVSFTPTGATTYTVGSGANVNMVRPARIDGMFWRSGGIDYYIDMLDTLSQWESIPDKTEAGEPLVAFYNPTITTGTLYLYPQPSSGTVFVRAQASLPFSNALADTITLPDNYLLPIRLNLYVLLAGMYGAQLKPALVKWAEQSLKSLKRNNLRIETLPMPESIPMRRRSNIISGE